MLALTCKVRAENNLVLIGDLMKSIEVLQYDNVHRQLKVLSRDYQQQFVSVANFLSEDEYVVFDMYRNISILRRSGNAAGAGESDILDVCGEFHLGDSVNAFHQGSRIYKF